MAKITVKATQQGYFNRRLKPGDKFECEPHQFSENWMEISNDDVVSKRNMTRYENSLKGVEGPEDEEVKEDSEDESEEGSSEE